MEIDGLALNFGFVDYCVLENMYVRLKREIKESKLA